MARPKKRLFDEDYGNAPETLESNPFYGIILDEKQKIFRDAIWNPENDIIMCNAKAGCGKGLVSVGTANLLVQYGRYEGIVYVVSPVQEQRIGFLPGSADEKISPYGAPLYDALLKINVDPNSSINQNSVLNQKNGTGYIDCISHVYLRGCNLENKVVIIDEAQNYYFDELKKTLTRICKNAKVIVIGHTGQCDLIHAPEHSGFAPYIEHFRGHDHCQICELTENHRGWVSNWADEAELAS